LVAAIACWLPAAFLLFYQQAFGLHPVIIVFGQAAVLLVLALVGLVSLAIGVLRPPGRTRTCARFLGVATAVLFGGLVLIYTGAYISNSVWGDTLNYSIALTFAAHSSAVVDFLPISPEQKTKIFMALLAAAVAALLIIVFVALKASSRLVTGLQHWLSDPAPGKRRLIGLTGTLAATAVASAGVCAALMAAQPRSLYGEPISAFFKLIPASSLLGIDNARLAAAVEDRDSRAAYKKPEQFKPKNVILIMSDALRADRMGVYGYDRPTTPFLSDLFAKKLLHRVDMALSTCSETFCGVASTLASRPFHQISPHNFKLHSLLRDLGYRVNFFLTGDHRTWNYLLDFYGADLDEVYDFGTLRAKDMHDDRNIIDALGKIAPAGPQPNFFYFFLMSSHVSGTKIPEFERFKPAYSDGMRLMTFWNELAGTQRVGEKVVSQRLGPKDFEAVLNRYDNGVLQTDAMLARIFAILEAKGYLRNSIVAILGDHGDGLGEHGHIGHTRYLYQEDIHIPLLIYDEDIGQYQNSSFATQIDVAPTIVERLGLPVPRGWQGQSLMKPATDRMTLHQTRRGQTPCFAVVERLGASLMKYLRCGAGATSSELLFDLVADPWERDDLVPSASASQLARYRREIDSHFTVVVNPCKTFECRD
jgi:glucan phosphoethanolaminetransferase (alkaline phosphatase superfamily)